MGRRESRETALQILFQLEFNDTPEDVALSHFQGRNKGGAEYSQRLTKGVVSHREKIDSLIQSYSENWRVSRMLYIDRNILRLAVYELLFEKEIAAAVVINEAVELAKKFGSNESAKFVNGILDALSKDPLIQEKSSGNKNG